MVDVHLPCGEFDDPLYFGVLVPAHSDVAYHVQCGGELCDHASLEGVYLPLLRDDLEDVEPKLRGYGTLSELAAMSSREARGYWVKHLAGLPDGVFRAPTGNEVVEFLRENPDADHVGEAWLPVAVAGSATSDVNWRDLLGGFVGRVVVIVWGNSD